MRLREEPINYLVARQEQESFEVIVLALVDAARTKLPAAELLLGARAGKFPGSAHDRVRAAVGEHSSTGR